MVCIVGHVCSRTTLFCFFLSFAGFLSLTEEYFFPPPFSLRFDGVEPCFSLFLSLSLFLFLFCFIRKNEQNFPLSYKTCKFSHDFDFEMSVNPIFCRISLARCKERCVFEFRILLALCCAFFSRVSLRRI